MTTLFLHVRDGQEERHHRLEQPEVTVGRLPDNHICLPRPEVSGRHCTIHTRGQQVLIEDAGSTNGTLVNGQPIQGPTSIGVHDKIQIGPFDLQLSEPSDAPHPPHAKAHLFELSPAERAWRDTYLRIQRYSDQWNLQGRPHRLLLGAKDAPRYAAWLRDPPPPGVPAVTALQRTFVEASTLHHRHRARLRIGLSAAIGTCLLALGVWSLNRPAPSPNDHHRPPATTPDPVSPTPPTSIPGADDPIPPPPKWIEHQVIPAETLSDIARRYGVSVKQLARWNKLNPDDPSIESGDEVRVKPDQRPLPQQRIEYEVEPGETWRKLSERFDVAVSKLRAYNPDTHKDLEPGERITVWIDPKPPPDPTKVKPLPKFDVRPDAISKGKPWAGWLDNGIQFPESQLYIRRAPYRMWGSSHAILNLQRALARFRQRYGYDGVLVVADISKRDGGYFPPHGSHQAGRDADIWLPMLRGVYKADYLGVREHTPTEKAGWRVEWGRRPEPEEADWFATWGLVESLISTGEVKYIFLEYELQKKVFQAAKIMGATDEEFKKAMQWPRGPHASGILSHSDNHTHHIHVRFKCGPREDQCSD